MRYTAILILLFIFISSGCKPKPTPKTYCEDNPGNCSNIQGVKNFFVFKEGSWWVYEEENSGDRDSVFVTESVNNSSNYDFDLRVYSTYQGYFYHYFPEFASGNSNCTANGNINSNCVYVKRSKYKPGDYVGEGICFLFTYKLNDWQYVPNLNYTNNRITVTDIQNNYDLGDLSFLETVKLTELNTYQEGKQPTNHYFSKNVGLIRKELLDSNQVWNLVNYYIEP